jgi:hypothetical protein
MAMADPRLNSCHFFDCPDRRQQYRAARETLLAARGWLTMTAEQFRDWVGDSADWPALLPVRLDQLIPGTKFVLADFTAGCAYPLKPGLNTIGRLPDNDIVWEEKVVSRRHCVLLVHTSGGAELHDTASRNGTYVNDRRVRQPVPLSSGDRIRVCDRHLLFLSEQDYLGGEEDESHPDTALHFPAEPMPEIHSR